jgi:hypothetical protein
MVVVLVLGCSGKPEDTPPRSGPVKVGLVPMVNPGVGGSGREKTPAPKPSKDEVTALAQEFIAKELHGKGVEIGSVSDPMDPPLKEKNREPDLLIYAVTYKSDGPTGKRTQTNLLLLVGRDHVLGADRTTLAVRGHLNDADKIRERLGNDWYDKEWKGKHHLADPSSK